ncbi:MAG TPA: hypothetical protein VFQ41_00775 [Candidatus Angelobacter sp.]|nr:hypothetical protein [Candidatus Angelobacter sp.]
MKRPIAWTLVILMVAAALGKKKRQITMSDFPLIGVVCMDALDASGMFWRVRTRKA